MATPSPKDGDIYDKQIMTKAVKAGRRTYFFDVRATRGDDYFVTITESRKKSNDDGSFAFDRHKIFLYKEDFSKFADGLADVIDFIKTNKADYFEQNRDVDSVEELDIDKEFANL